MKGNKRLRNDLLRDSVSEANTFVSHLTPAPRALNTVNIGSIVHKISKTQQPANNHPPYANKSPSEATSTPLAAFTSNKLEDLTPCRSLNNTAPSRITPNIFSNFKKPLKPYPGEYHQPQLKPCAPYRHLSKQMVKPSETSLTHGPNDELMSYTSTPTVEEISAGGIVVDASEGFCRVAIIARHNRAGRVEWCLPKGHPEGRETLTEAATREVEEETGIVGNIIATLGNVDYWFSVSRYRVHKTVHHFLLERTGGMLTAENDPDQEIVDVAWIKIEDLGHHLTFLNEKRIAELAIHTLKLQ